MSVTTNTNTNTNIFNEFSKALQKWLSLEDTIANYNQHIKKIKEQKNILEKKLIQFIEKNNLKTTQFSIDNNTINYAVTNTNASLSIKLIEEVLNETVQDKNLKNRILTNINIKKTKLAKHSISLKNKKTKGKFIS
jgi:hypothetical protein